MTGMARRRLLADGLLAALLAVLGGPARADSYPDRSVRVVVPFTAGGTTDFVARLVAEKMSELAGQRFYVENKTGGSGMVGLREVAGAAPDGYTLAVTDTSIAIAPSLSTKAGVSPTMFEPVCLIATFPSVMVIHPGVPARTVAELIDYARRNPGKINYGSGGIGTGPHLQGELFRSLAKIDIQHVAYRGAAAALQDVVGGSIQLLFTAAPTAMSFVRAGQLTLLATTGAERLPVAGAVPTMVEAGLKDFVSEQWFGLLAPAKTPGDIVARANEIAARALADGAVVQRIRDQGGFPKPGTPAAYAQFIDREVRAWGNIVATANITVPQ